VANSIVLNVLCFRVLVYFLPYHLSLHFLRSAKGALVDVFNGDYRSILASKITSRPKLKHLSLIAKLILFRSMTSCQGEVL
jgi:hypothetical protein